MVCKTTVTLYPPKGDGPVEAQPDQVARMEEKGWVQKQPSKSAKKKSAAKSGVSKGAAVVAGESPNQGD